MDHFPETPLIVMRRVKPTRFSNNSSLSRSCNSLVMNCFFVIYLQIRRIVSHLYFFFVDVVALNSLHAHIFIQSRRTGEAVRVNAELYAWNTASVEFSKGMQEQGSSNSFIPPGRLYTEMIHPACVRFTGVNIQCYTHDFVSLHGQEPQIRIEGFPVHSHTFYPALKAQRSMI